jgi:hypothetical protein
MERIKLSSTQNLVVSIVDNEKLDLRMWLDSKNYTVWRRNGLKFYLFDGIWEEFKRLIDKVDKAYGEIA